MEQLLSSYVLSRPTTQIVSNISECVGQLLEFSPNRSNLFVVICDVTLINSTPQKHALLVNVTKPVLRHDSFRIIL